MEMWELLFNKENKKNGIAHNPKFKKLILLVNTLCALCKKHPKSRNTSVAKNYNFTIFLNCTSLP